MHVIKSIVIMCAWIHEPIGFMNLLDTIMQEQHHILEVSYSSPPLKYVFYKNRIS